MIRTIISLGILSGLIGLLTVYPDIVFIALGVKSMIIYALSLIYSELTIFLLFFEVAWVVGSNIVKKL